MNVFDMDKTKIDKSTYVGQYASRKMTLKVKITLNDLSTYSFIVVFFLSYL